MEKCLDLAPVEHNGSNLSLKSIVCYILYIFGTGMVYL